MDLPTIGALAVLALLDSTSIGTLVLPVWLLLRPGPSPVRRVLVHLGVVAGCYAVVGGVLLAVGTGASAALGARADGLLPWGQLVLGAGLLVGSFALDSGRRRRSGLPDRTERWRARVAGSSDRGAVALAGAAVALELATMLPYLAALGIVGAAGLPVAARGGLLLAYCLVMVLPALVLLVARTVAADRVAGPLRRIDAWAARQGDSALGWVVGIGGFLLARDALGRLGGLDSVLARLS